GADRCRRLAIGLFALDDDLADLAGLEQSSLDELFHQGLVLLFVFVRQGVLVGAQADDDVFFSRRRVTAQADGHFGHGKNSLVVGRSALTSPPTGSAAWRVLAGTALSSSPIDLASIVFFSSRRSRSTSREDRLSLRMPAARLRAPAITSLTWRSSTASCSGD